MPTTSAADRAEPGPPVLAVGAHHLAEFGGCDVRRIADVAAVEAPFLRAVAASGARILSHASHQFRPEGVTVVALLAESHASVHTWPEHGYAGVDFFTCSPSMDAGAMIRELAAAFGAATVTVRVVPRGLPG